MDQFYRLPFRTRFVLTYLYTLGCSHADADDIAQDIEVYLLRHPPKQITKTYLYMLARHRLISKKRGRKYLPLDFDLAMPEQQSDPRMEHMLSCLEQLKPNDREAIILHYWKGLSRAEAAEVTGLTKNGWKNRLQDAKARLRKLCHDT